MNFLNGVNEALDRSLTGNPYQMLFVSADGSVCLGHVDSDLLQEITQHLVLHLRV